MDEIHIWHFIVLELEKLKGIGTMRLKPATNETFFTNGLICWIPRLVTSELL